MDALSAHVAKTVSFNIESASASQTDTDIIENFQQKKALIRTANVAGTNAADFKFYPGRNKGKTTVDTDAAAAATSVIVDTTNVGGTEVNGRAITTSDFLLVQLDKANSKNKIWQLLDITATSAGTSKNTLTVSAFDGGTGLEEAITALNIAYIVASEDVATIDVDANALQLEFTFVGFNGHPLALSINEGASGTTHRANGIAQYVE